MCFPIFLFFVFNECINVEFQNNSWMFTSNYWKVQVPYENLKNILRCMTKISTIDEDSENYGLWAKSGLPLVFVNKVLLEYSHTHLLIDYLWLFSYYNSRVSSYNRDQMPLLSGPLLKVFQPVRDISMIFIYSLIHLFICSVNTNFVKEMWEM